MLFLQRFTARSTGGIPLADTDVLLLGNEGLALHYSLPGPARPPGRLQRNTVPLYETGWQLRRGSESLPPTRSDFMRVLANVTAVLVRATAVRDMQEAALLKVNMDIAVPQQTGGPPAITVEEVMLCCFTVSILYMSSAFVRLATVAFRVKPASRATTGRGQPAWPVPAATRWAAALARAGWSAGAGRAGQGHAVRPQVGAGH